MKYFRAFLKPVALFWWMKTLTLLGMQYLIDRWYVIYFCRMTIVSLVVSIVDCSLRESLEPLTVVVNSCSSWSGTIAFISSFFVAIDFLLIVKHYTAADCCTDQIRQISCFLILYLVTFTMLRGMTVLAK